MASDDGGGLHDFVAGRYAELRRSAFLMCGDWALADECTQKSLARLVAKSRRTAVDDPDAFVYSHLMASFRRRRSRSRQHLYVAPRVAPDEGSSAVPDPVAETSHPTRAVSTTEETPEQPHPRKIAEDRDRKGDGAAEDPIRTILLLDALHKLAPRCRAVLVLRHWDGFAVDETADMLGLAGERVDAYEAAGLAALDYLLPEKERAR